MPTNGVPGAQALKSGRTRAELLGVAIAQTRRLVAPDALEQACTAQAMALGALEQAYTAQAGVGLIAIELKSGKIAYQSPSFEDLTSWLPVEARGNIRVSLESRDGDDFHSLCRSVERDAGEPCGETFLDRDKVVGRVIHRSVTVRFFTRAPGPPGLRNPEWLLFMRAVKLTLVGVQPLQLAGESPAAGRTKPFWGYERIPEAIGVFMADLSGGTPSLWTLQVAHVRYFLDLEVPSGTYDVDVSKSIVIPLELIAKLFNFGFSKEEGACASLFSRAAAHVDYAATSALHIAQRAVSWLNRKALRFTDQWVVRLNDDDTVSISRIALFSLFGGLKTSLSVDLTGGQVGFSHGGLEFMFFVADPEQPLDGHLRSTIVRINSAKTFGSFDVQHPIVASRTWDHAGNYHIFSPMLSVDLAGKKVSSTEDVSQLLERLKISPGGGHLSDGRASICVGQSDEQPRNLTCTPTDNVMRSPTAESPIADDWTNNPEDWWAPQQS